MLAISRIQRLKTLARTFSSTLPSSENPPDQKTTIYAKNQVAPYKPNPQVSLIIRSTSPQELNNQSAKEKF